MRLIRESRALTESRKPIKFEVGQTYEDGDLTYEVIDRTQRKVTFHAYGKDPAHGGKHIDKEMTVAVKRNMYNQEVVFVLYGTYIRAYPEENSY